MIGYPESETKNNLFHLVLETGFIFSLPLSNYRFCQK